MAKKKAKTEKRSVGRPRIEVDVELVGRLANIQCTDEEIASALDICVDTLRKRKKDTPDLSDLIEKGHQEGKRSIRRMQFATAAAGNPTMQIWLGKQYLDQSDRRIIAGDDDAPIRVSFNDVAARLLPELASK